MSDLQRIEETLKRTALRRRWLHGWKALGQGALGGGLIWFLTLVCYKLFPIPAQSLFLAGMVALAILIGFVVHGLLRRISIVETAQWVDDRRHLKERISTALEVAREPSSEEWKSLIVTDAARHMSEVKPRELLPFRFHTVMKVALLVLIMGVGLGFVPEYRTQAYKAKIKETDHMKAVGKKLAELTRQNLVRQPALLPPTTKALETVAELGDQLKQARLTRSEALRDLTTATDKLREQQDQLKDNPAMKSLERAAREPSKSAPTPGDLQKQIEAMQKALGDKASDPDKIDDLKQKLEDMQKSAGGMPDENSPEGKAARQKMAQALAQLAQEAKSMGASLPDLENAINALKNNQADIFLKDLQAALNDLDKMKQMAKAMQQLQQQAAKTGRDLAEQLEKGQAQAAQATLQKMIKDLDNSELSNEQKQQIMNEVAKAIDPAGDYGKVAQHLKDAVRQMKQNQQPGAAQSLADAKQELEKMMQQMADAQSLQAAMNALERAQMALASGKSWEQSQSGYCSSCGGAGCSNCKPGPGKFGPGGKPGAGVGTWADEGGWTYQPQNQAMVDNSGIVRPDMDSRGLSERPEDLNENLNPTKLKGQMSPGGSMPSITLKGVHIKGQSNVKYEQAAATAQADAQSALNQDKVPRPYLNSVRDYFDDLKE